MIDDPTPAGETFLRQLEELTARTRQFVDRAKDRQLFRAAQGRAIAGDEGRAQLHQLASSVGELAGELESLLREPHAEPELAEIHAAITAALAGPR